MQAEPWMIYGATGFTGRLIVEEAMRKGLRPLLAGRSAEKLRRLAEQHGLEWQAIDLKDREGLEATLAQKRVVLHAAGPYIRTARPMQEACLRTGTHYIDITGEIPVFEQTFALDQAAREAGIAMISGAGLDVVPSDCLAVYLAGQLPRGVHLELAVGAVGRPSAGTVKSALGMMPNGGLVRREGELRPWKLGEGARRIRFADRERTVIPAPWGDLVTAYHSTGISNITTYLAYPPRLIPWVRRGGPVLRKLLRLGPVRGLAEKLAERFVHGPDEQLRQEGRSQFYGCVRDGHGNQVEAWQETGEAYALTAQTAVRAVERLLEAPQAGALSPAQAFGADFILEVENTRRMTHLRS
jgi:short subunit dehydrogenase-like uncharacterized protein